MYAICRSERVQESPLLHKDSNRIVSKHTLCRVPYHDMDAKATKYMRLALTNPSALYDAGRAMIL